MFNLLRELDDEQLDLQIEYYRWWREHTTGRERYGFTNHLSSAVRVRTDRRQGVS